VEPGVAVLNSVALERNSGGENLERAQARAREPAILETALIPEALADAIE